jgi:hypothetical protein
MFDLKYILLLLSIFWDKLKKKVNFFIVGRILEGISIGMYANNINIFVDNGMDIDLIYKILVAIILTIVGINLQRR